MGAGLSSVVPEVATLCPNVQGRCRRAFRDLEPAGVPRSLAMKITGHKTESVYRRYAIVSDADLREATRRLAQAATVTRRVGTFPGTTVGSPTGAAP